jgi:GDP-D-mannose dehydratase
MEGHKSALILGTKVHCKQTQLINCAGITGQDGSYLAEYLLKKEYCVHGLVRRSVAPSENGFLLERLATYGLESFHSVKLIVGVDLLTTFKSKTIWFGV